MTEQAEEVQTERVGTSIGFSALYCPVQVIDNPVQVKSPDEIKAGKNYMVFDKSRRNRKGEPTGEVLRVTKVFPEKGYFEAELIKDKYDFTRLPREVTIAMRDMGIIPDGTFGYYNTATYLVPENAENAYFQSKLPGFIELQ